MELRCIFHSFLPAMPGPDIRIHTRLQLTFTFYLSHSFFSLPILCYYSPRLCVTHPLTLELKFSPPPLLICSLHYSFITHLRSLCSASVSLFLFIPLLQADVSNILPVRQPNFLTWGGGGKSHKTREFEVGCLIYILQGVTICLKRTFNECRIPT